MEESGAVTGKETTEAGFNPPESASSPSGASAALSSSPSRIHRGYWALLALVTVILCLPVLNVRYVPLTDFPSHLASAYIMFHYHQIPVYQRYFTFNVAPIPDLALEIIIPLLLHFMSILTAGKVFLVLTLLLFVAGCHLLGKAIHGRETWLALACVFFFYNYFFFLGEVNFLFGLALFAIALACSLRWRARWSMGTLGLASALYCGVYISHLGGYGFLGFTVVTIAAYEWITHRIRLRQAVLDLIPLVPPLILFFVFMRSGGTAGNASYPVVWPNRGQYITGAIGVLITYSHRQNRLFALCAAVIVIVLFYYIFQRKIGLIMRTTLAGIVLLALFILCPYQLFTSDQVGLRFMPAALLLLVLSLRISLTRRTGALLLGAWLALSVARVACIGAAWRGFDRVFTDGVSALEILPKGARVYPLFDSALESLGQRAFEYCPVYATIYEEDFVPSLWALRSAEPLIFRQDPRYYYRSDADRARALESYDYAWSWVVSPAQKRILEAECTPILEKGGFTIWRVNHAGGESAARTSP